MKWINVDEDYLDYLRKTEKLSKKPPKITFYIPITSYAELSPESQQVVDEYTRKLLKNLGKRD